MVSNERNNQVIPQIQTNPGESKQAIITVVASHLYTRKITFTLERNVQKILSSLLHFENIYQMPLM